MKILSSTEHFGEFYIAVVVLLVCTIFLINWFGYEFMSWIKDMSNYKSYGFLFFTFATSIGFAYMMYCIHKIGPTIEYKALVTDFNEVYENGYVVVDREGEIYILEKDNK